MATFSREQIQYTLLLKPEPSKHELIHNMCLSLTVCLVVQWCVLPCATLFYHRVFERIQTLHTVRFPPTGLLGPGAPLAHWRVPVGTGKAVKTSPSVQAVLPGVAYETWEGNAKPNHSPALIPRALCAGKVRRSRTTLQHILVLVHLCSRGLWAHREGKAKPNHSPAHLVGTVRGR